MTTQLHLVTVYNPTTKQGDCKLVSERKLPDMILKHKSGQISILEMKQL